MNRSANSGSQSREPAPLTLVGTSSVHDCGPPARDMPSRRKQYARFAELGVEFGQTFRGLEDVRRGPSVATARTKLPSDSRAADSHFIR